MSNFAETMAFWYLRLNGFFPLLNYVHHEGGPQDSDMDIIALRLPHTRETVRGYQIAYDDRLLPLDVNINVDTIGVLAEVKSGLPDEPPEMDDDRRNRLRGAIERTGIFDGQPADLAYRDLIGRPMSRPAADKRVMVKLFFHNGWPSPRRWVGWHAVDLVEVNAFIRQRFREYQEKNRGRVLFPSDLIQYLMWDEEGRDTSDDRNLM